MFVKVLSGGGCGLLGLYFFKSAWTDFISEDHFETRIADRRYVQKIPRENHFQTFEVSIDEIDYIEKKIKSGNQSGATTSIVLKDGKKKQITNAYWNPTSKIIKHFQSLRPELELRIVRDGRVA